MPKIRIPLPAGSVSIERVIAYNFERARRAKGWTQVEASNHLAGILGYELRQAGVSAIESGTGHRRQRAFTSAELVAFAQCFDRPLAWWLIPPSHWVGLPGPVTTGEQLTALTFGSPQGWAALLQAATELATALNQTGHPAPWMEALPGSPAQLMNWPT